MSQNDMPLYRYLSDFSQTDTCRGVHASRTQRAVATAVASMGNVNAPARLIKKWPDASVRMLDQTIRRTRQVRPAYADNSNDNRTDDCSCRLSENCHESGLQR